MNLTPNKRKRESFGGDRVVGTLKTSTNEKENYAYNSGFMEVKSLADIRTNSTNPFEVVRKPPKKKKKCDTDDEGNNCFINPALNLNGPEHVVNPFEIRRPLPNVRDRDAGDQHCFVNPGLNIRGPEKEVRNPFEIVRQNVQEDSGLENGGFNVRSPMIKRAIAIPFTPTIGCRINFTDVPLESLTPCSMLAKKLVFSPVYPNGYENATPTKITGKTKADDVELSVISEESLDIIAELDCYQLELENSINEAKINKKKRRSSAGRSKNLMDLKNRKSFAMLLNQAEETASPPEKEKVDVSLATQLTPKLDNIPVITEETTMKNHSGVDYEEIDDLSEDEFEFKNPVPFKRTFKRKSIRKPTPDSSRSSAESLAAPEPQKHKSIGSTIRNSIRRIVKPNQKKAVSSDQLNENVADQQSSNHSNLFASIRQSLRRKPVVKNDPTADSNPHELSILVDSDRKVYRQQTSANMPARSSEDLAESSGFGRKTSLRSSFRNTTKDVRRQVLKSMFKKNVEEYQFE